MGSGTEATPARRAVWRPGGVATNTALSGVRTLTRLGVGFVLLPILVRSIGSTETGLFLFATTLTGYFTAIDLSFGASVTKYVAEYRATGSSARVAPTVRASLAVMALAGLLIAAVLAVVAVTAAGALFREHQLRSVAEPTLLVAAATALVYWPSRIGVAALSGLERYDQAAAIQIASSLVILPTLAILAGEHASVPVLAAVFGCVSALEGVVAALLSWRPLGVDRSWARGRWLRGTALGPVVRFGAAAFLIGLADTLIFSFDRTIISATVGAAAIVGYELALRPHTALRTVAGMSGLALVSPTARLAAVGDRERMRRLVLVASFVSVVVTTPLIVLAIDLAHPFVVAWLGPGFGRYAVYVQLFVSYLVVFCWGTAISSALYGAGQIRTYALLEIGKAIAAVVLSIALGIAWGTVGVIWGTVIPSCVELPIFIVVALRALEIPARQFLLDAILPAYRVIVPWAGAVVLAAALTSPSGYAGLALFGAAALAVFALAASPQVRLRWRRATAPAT